MNCIDVAEELSEPEFTDCADSALPAFSPAYSSVSEDIVIGFIYNVNKTMFK